MCATPSVSHAHFRVLKGSVPSLYSSVISPGRQTSGRAGRFACFNLRNHCFPLQEPSVRVATPAPVPGHAQNSGGGIYKMCMAFSCSFARKRAASPLVALLSIQPQICACTRAASYKLFTSAPSRFIRRQSPVANITVQRYRMRFSVAQRC